MTDEMMSLRTLVEKTPDADLLRAVQRARYMTLETIVPLSDDPLVSLAALAS